MDFIAYQTRIYNRFEYPQASRGELCEDIYECRAQKAGATVADELDSGVTHVIAQKGTSAKQASAKLQIAGTHSPVLVRGAARHSHHMQGAMARETVLYYVLSDV